LCNLSRKMVILIVLITVVHKNGNTCITDSTLKNHNINTRLPAKLSGTTFYKDWRKQMGDQMVVHDAIITMNTDISCGYDLITSPLTGKLTFILYMKISKQ
jgi:hypothetical protein